MKNKTLKQESDFSRIFGNSFFLIVHEIIKAVANLGVIALLVRYFDLTTFGDYCFVFVLCNIFQVLTTMGMDSIIIREIAKRPETAAEMFDASFHGRIWFSFATFGAIALSVNLLSSSPEVIHAAYVGALGVIALVFSNLPFAVFQGYQRMEFLTIIGIATNIVYLVLIVIFVGLGAGLKGIFFPTLIANLLGFVMGLCIVRKKFFVPGFRLDFKACRSLVRKSYPVGVGRILRKAGHRIPTVLIKVIRGSVEVGLFSGVYRLFLQLSFIPRNIVMSVFPVFSKRYAKGTDSLDFAFGECFKMFAVLSIPLVILLFFFAEDIIILLFTEKLIGSVPVFKVLSVAWGFMFVSVLLTDTLIAIGKENLMTLCVGLALAVNLVLALILIPLMGFVGAGVAALVAEVVLFVIAYRFISKHLVHLPLGRLLTGPAIGGLVLILACYWATRTSSFAILLPIMVLGCACYMGSLILSKTLTRKEYEWGKELVQAFLADRGVRNGQSMNSGNKVKGY